jgi:hypothetical protein
MPSALLPACAPHAGWLPWYSAVACHAASFFSMSE